MQQSYGRCNFFKPTYPTTMYKNGNITYFALINSLRNIDWTKYVYYVGRWKINTTQDIISHGMLKRIPSTIPGTWPNVSFWKTLETTFKCFNFSLLFHVPSTQIYLQANMLEIQSWNNVGKAAAGSSFIFYTPLREMKHEPPRTRGPFDTSKETPMGGFLLKLC